MSAKETSKISQESLESVRKSLETRVDTQIQEQIELLTKGFKMQIKSVFDTIETMQNAASIWQKETNLKIGAIAGVRTRKAKEEGVQYFSSPEEALAYAELVRSKLIRPVSVPEGMGRYPGVSKVSTQKGQIDKDKLTKDAAEQLAKGQNPVA